MARRTFLISLSFFYLEDMFKTTKPNIYDEKNFMESVNVEFKTYWNTQVQVFAKSAKFGKGNCFQHTLSLHTLNVLVAQIICLTITTTRKLVYKIKKKTCFHIIILKKNRFKLKCTAMLFIQISWNEIVWPILNNISLFSSDIYTDLISPGLDNSKLSVQTWRPELENNAKVSNIGPEF